MIVLVWLAYVVAAICGLFSAVTFGKSVYHQWAKRGTTSGLVVNTFLSLVSGFVALGALYLASLQSR